MKTSTQQVNQSHSEHAGGKKQAPAETIIQAFKDNHAIQLKTEKERGDKHRRVEAARAEIESKTMDESLRAHLFEGEPNEDEFDPNEPTGLHAYTDGELPKRKYTTDRNVKKEASVDFEVSGNPNKIHTINWNWSTSNNDDKKSSTMFPQNMPPQHVVALVDGDLKTKTKEYIKHGLKFKVEHKGDTAYPVKE